MAAVVEYQSGPFAVLFAWLGLFAGAAMGAETHQAVTIVLCSLIMAAVGFFIGRLRDALIAWLIFIFVSVVELLINDEVRVAVVQMFG